MTAEKKKAQQDKNLLSKKTLRQAEDIEAVAKSKITHRENMKRCHEAESIVIFSTRKKIDRENKKRHSMAESHDAAATPKSNSNTSKRETARLAA
jgi:hypothetical protein